MLPRILIRPTPANDLYLFLSLLVPSREIAQLIDDPRRLIRERQGELRFLEQVAQGYGLLWQPPSDTRPEAPAAVGNAKSPAPPENAARILGRTSLLR